MSPNTSSNRATREAESDDSEKARRVAKILSAYYDAQSLAQSNTLGYPINATFRNWIPDKLRNMTFIHVGDPFTSLCAAPNVLALEHEVLQCGMKLWNVPNIADYWGYVTSGSSESIMQALYSAREVYPDASLFYSAAAHYSVPKAGHLLGIKDMVPVTATSRGEMDLEALADRLAERRGCRVIMVLTCGTTMHEGHDNIADALQVLDEAGIPDVCRYVHIDAALSGMVVPFDDDAPWEIRPSFRHGVDSISMSGHKMIGTPMPCGIFVAHRRYRDGTACSAEYVSSEDPTVACSRNGQAVIEIWVRLSGHGLYGYAADVKRCLKLASDLTEELRRRGIPATRNDFAITVCFPKPSETIVAHYHLACAGDLAHVVVMPSVTRELVGRFLDEYSAWWSTSRCGTEGFQHRANIKF